MNFFIIIDMGIKFCKECIHLWHSNVKLNETVNLSVGIHLPRFVPRWNGACTRDGKIGLCAPTRGGLDLIELKRGTSIQPLISRAAEGVFSIITMFSSTDNYVFYYHSGRKTLRVFRWVWKVVWWLGFLGLFNGEKVSPQNVEL